MRIWNFFGAGACGRWEIGEVEILACADGKVAKGGNRVGADDVRLLLIWMMEVSE